ncbi:MAG TPA: DUF2156 domain-containing protein [Gemmatimonadaceae bacterium]|nr:DUF2156 domain-containing protein [Gemmatimonadaceae bacterium]
MDPYGSDPDPAGRMHALEPDSTRRLSAVASPSPATLFRARSLVLRYGWNATAYQILNPGIGHWFSANGDAVVGFVTRNRVRVVAGAPVCEQHALREVAAEFETAASAAGEHVCYFGAGERLEDVYRGRYSHSMIALGAQPSWDPRLWPEIIATRASVRAQLHRARNKGVEVEEWPSARATRNPQLQRCLSEWLESRPLPPLHFLVEPETLSFLLDRRVLVAVRDGTPVGFLVASPVPARTGWLIEQFVRGHQAPNGTAELLIDAAMRTLAAQGARYVTLGLAPLSRHARPVPGPLWLKVLLGWVRLHGRRFYNFEGLDRFKAKFQPPEWEEILAIYSEPEFSWRALYAIAAAFSDRSPPSMFVRALWKAVRQEGKWVAERVRG